jgi:hypothetical protein
MKKPTATCSRQLSAVGMTLYLRSVAVPVQNAMDSQSIVLLVCSFTATCVTYKTWVVIIKKGVAPVGRMLSYDTGNTGNSFLFLSHLHKFSLQQASRLCHCFSLLSDT